MYVGKIENMTDPKLISSAVKDIAENAAGSTNHITGDTVYFEVGYLTSCLATANKNIKELQRRLDEVS